MTEILAEFNDLRKINCLRKSEVFVERISVYNAIEIWRSMTFTVFNAPTLMTSKICYRNSYDVILMYVT